MGAEFTLEAISMNCENCGSSKLSLQSRKGIAEEFLCNVCGHITVFKVTYSPDPLLEYINENCVFLTADIPESASKLQLVKLRDSIPILKKFSIDEMKRAFVAGTLEFGAVHKDRVEEIRYALESSHLQFVLHVQPCSEQEEPEGRGV